MGGGRVDEPVDDLRTGVGLDVDRDPPRLAGGVDTPHLQVRCRVALFAHPPVGGCPQYSVATDHVATSAVDRSSTRGAVSRCRYSAVPGVVPLSGGSEPGTVVRWPPFARSCSWTGTTSGSRSPRTSSW